jgi:MFS transporter, PHS family, inorganic phosphate transporter
MMAAVFAMQGFGQLAAAIVALITTVAFRKTFSAARTVPDCTGQCQFAADRSWRIIIGFGILPAVFALYYRLTIPETPRFTFDVALDAEKANADIRIFIDAEVALEQIDAFQRNSSNRLGLESQIQSQIDGVDNLLQPRSSWSDFYKYFHQYRNGSVLFATMASWFLLDFSFYGLALNNNVELAVLGFGPESGPSVYRDLLATSLGNLILVCAGGLPGYLLTVLAIDTLGRKLIQGGGFAILTAVFLIIGFGYDSFDKTSLMGLYILAQLFFNFGPNSTTFIISAECFPTRYRSTCHGLSAAAGKLGAVVIQLLSNPLLTKNATSPCTLTACSPFLGHMMQIFAATSFCGTLVTLMLPDTKRQTLEVLAGEVHFGTQGSTSSRRGKDSLLARLTWRLHRRGMKAEVINSKGSTRSQGSPDIKSKNQTSSASVSSTGRIVPRPIRTRDSEHGLSGKDEDADISLQEMGHLLPEFR